ncbi:MAG: hypothetical protein QM535_22330 [Limnohabitans sp.]|nr:hypothetical protein [Limnohabitans sp.]
MNETTDLKQPYWLILINYWVQTRKRTGLTIPFIVGTYNLYLSKGNEDKETINSLLCNIVDSNIENPISVFNCDTIGEYVLTTYKMSGTEIKNKTTQKNTFVISLSAEILGKTIDDLVFKFEKMYNQSISENKYSKNNLSWTEFNEGDIKLIKEALGLDT